MRVSVAEVAEERVSLRAARGRPLGGTHSLLGTSAFGLLVDAPASLRLHLSSMLHDHAVDDLLGEIEEILWPEGTTRPRLWRPKARRPRSP